MKIFNLSNFYAEIFSRDLGQDELASGDIVITPMVRTVNTIYLFFSTVSKRE